jgi:transketolase
LSLHMLKPLDRAAVRNVAIETKGVITVEEHSVHGGLGEACASLLLQEGIHPRFKIVGFPDDHTVSGKSGGNLSPLRHRWQRTSNNRTSIDSN